jgi:ribosomal protein S18 acetylase RimI-like enzyme
MVQNGVISQKEIYRQVAHLHVANLDQGFLATMGVGFLAELYRAIDKCPQSVLIVKCEQGKVVGFVSGLAAPMSVVYRRLMRRFLIWSMPLFPVLGSPARMSRVVEILRYAKSESPHLDLPTPELLSIVVASDCRGKGVAESMYADLIDYFRQVQVAKFKIVVGEKLLPAQRFYDRMGALPLAEMELHQGAKSVVYVQTVTQ